MRGWLFNVFWQNGDDGSDGSDGTTGAAPGTAVGYATDTGGTIGLGTGVVGPGTPGNPAGLGFSVSGGGTGTGGNAGGMAGGGTGTAGAPSQAATTAAIDALLGRRAAFGQGGIGSVGANDFGVASSPGGPSDISATGPLAHAISNVDTAPLGEPPTNLNPSLIAKLNAQLGKQGVAALSPAQLSNLSPTQQSNLTAQLAANNLSPAMIADLTALHDVALGPGLAGAGSSTGTAIGTPAAPGVNAPASPTNPSASTQPAGPGNAPSPAAPLGLNTSLNPSLSDLAAAFGMLGGGGKGSVQQGQAGYGESPLQGMGV
jgi:hypothetical protein